jgi:hypothetical protein
MFDDPVSMGSTTNQYDFYSFRPFIKEPEQGPKENNLEVTHLLSAQKLSQVPFISIGGSQSSFNRKTLVH